MDHIHPLTAFRKAQTPPLSVQDLADLLKKPRPTVHRWEKGTRKPEPDELPGIVDKTGIPAARLRPDLAKLFIVPKAPAKKRSPARSRRPAARVKRRAA